MATTKENLETAFAGESQANRKYLAFAKKAEADGFANIGKLFRTAAAAETIHAHGHLDALDGVGSTADNLQAAIDGETYETEEMYPPMLEQAEKDGHKGARMFKFAMKAERIHADLYQKALDSLGAGNDLDVEFFLCPVCGNIEVGSAPGACPICGAPGSAFTQV